MEEKNGCPIERMISFLGTKWTLFILKILSKEDSMRFNEISKNLENISPRTLSKRLKELEKEGFIIRKKFNEIPPRVEYSLSEKGMEFKSCFDNLNDLILKWEE